MTIDKVSIPLVRAVIVGIAIISAGFYSGTYMERVNLRMSTLEKQVEKLTSEVSNLANRIAYR
jgi:outer membrane murein-binding lipoprotein Lpp